MSGADVEAKAWATAVARAAMRGYALWRSDPADGPRSMFLGRWGQVRHIASMDELERVLAQIGA